MKIVYEHYRIPSYKVVDVMKYKDKASGIVANAERYNDEYKQSHKRHPDIAKSASDGRAYMFGYDPSPRGGVTVCRVYDDDNREIASGTAVCSMKDQFVYRIGRAIAKGRAMKWVEGERLCQPR